MQTITHTAAIKPARTFTVHRPKRFGWENVARFALLVGAAWLAVRIGFASHAITQDQTWLMYAAQQMLHGVPLYGTQLTETNPPLIIWLSAIPVALARMLSVPAPMDFYPLVLASIAASAFWCYRLLDGTATVIRRSQRVLFAACVMAAEMFLHLGDFGQREHLLIVFAIPYLVAFGIPRRTQLSYFHRLSIAVVAAVGICIKPQQVLLLLTFQLAIAVTTKSWRRPSHPANLALAMTFAVYAAYGAAILLFAPLYIRSELPVLMNTYWAFGRYTVAELVRLNRPFLLLFATGTILYRILARRGLASQFGGCLLLASFGASVAFDIQRTGFNYQYIPQNVLALLANLWMLTELVGHRVPTLLRPFVLRRRDWLPFGAALVVFAGFAVRHQDHLNAQPAPPSSTLEGFYASLPAGTPVFALSTNPQAGFPFVVQDRLVWASRFAHLWLLPAVQQNEYAAHGGPKPHKVLSPTVLASLASMQRSQVTEDINERKPAYILVPRCPSPLCEAIAEPRFNILGWFEKDAAFRAAWSNYHLLKPLEGGDRGTLDVYALDATPQRTNTDLALAAPEVLRER